MNNKYELKDYPCLYYLTNKLDEKNMCKFFCGLGTIFGLKPPDISKSSILFGSATKILFNGKGFEEDVINKHGESVFKKPFTDCNKLSRWHVVKDFNLKQESCIICPMSNEYKNARVESERLLLRQTIYTGKLTDHESEKFYSVVSIKPGNDISNYPLIPFLAYLNQFFIDNHPGGPYHDKESLISVFGEYLCEKLNFSETADREVVFECVKRELNGLYDFDFSILEGLANTAYIDLLSEYSYKVPKIMFPSSSSAFPPIVPIKKTTVKKKNHSPEQNLLYSKHDYTNDNEKKDKNTSPSKSKNSKNTIQVRDQEKDVKQKVNKSEKSDNVKPQTTQPAPSNQNLQEVNSTKSIDNEYNINTEYDFNSANTKKLEAAIFYPKYNVSKEFSSKIRHCTDEDPKSVLSFITDICSSQFISVESVVMYKRHGLLFMTSHRRNFYFYDLQYAPSGHLYTALSDTSKFKFISLNPLPVISMFSKIGFHSVQIESLMGLYWLYRSKENIERYSDMFKSVLSIENDELNDFYLYYMPLYEKLYSKLMNEMKDNKKIKEIEEYKEGIKLESALGVNYDLSDILYGLTNSISGQGFFDYTFNYNKDIPYIKKGVLYVVNLPDMNVDEYNSNSFFEKIAIQVHNTSIQYARSAKLITFVNKGIVYYSTINGDLFFDVLLDIIRRNYIKTYESTPVLKTYRVEYK